LIAKCESLSITSLQTERTKAEAKLELLQEGGINVDEFINAANNEAFTPEEEEPPTPVTATAPPPTNRDSVSTNNRASLAKSDSSAGMVTVSSKVVFSSF
jgi:hypothetical protein